MRCVYPERNGITAKACREPARLYLKNGNGLFPTCPYHAMKLLEAGREYLDAMRPMPKDAESAAYLEKRRNEYPK